MKRLYLIRVGEITLKKGNRKWFEKKLKTNIKEAMRPFGSRMTGSNGRFFLELAEGDEGGPSEELVIQRLSRTPGIVGFHPVRRVPKTLDDIKREARLLVDQQCERTADRRYKVESRRSDKSFPLNSYQLSCELGNTVGADHPELQVDVKNPQWSLHVEIRDHAYLYCAGWEGPAGLPVGSSGKALLLLSGGIDSPVAGYMMARRGVKLEAVYFHTPPYTSQESFDKVKELARRLAPWNHGLVLHAVPFTDVQVEINRRAPLNETTLHTRAAMMQISQRLAGRRKAKGLITGESLSQVASQTMESLRFTGSHTDLPVFRPLIGLDKTDIIQTARKIDTYRISVLPYDDCCVLFSPAHPKVKPDFEATRETHQNLELGELLDAAAEATDRISFPAGEG